MTAILQSCPLRKKRTSGQSFFNNEILSMTKSIFLMSEILLVFLNLRQKKIFQRKICIYQSSELFCHQDNFPYHYALA